MKEPTNAELADGRPWCIAGGWAACPQLATDQDVWIFITRYEDEDRIAILDNERSRMLRQWTAVQPQINAHADDLHTYGDLGIGILKIGTLGDRHILLTDAEDIQALLACFDISTHQCAIDEDMNFIKGPGWTPIGATPNILRTGGAQTAFRIEKITSRYCLA